MTDENKRNLRFATIVYWILLIYIVAALLWWALLLIKQNEYIYQLEKENISYNTAIAEQQEDAVKIEKQKKRNFAKYVGEGSFFLLLIMVGAVFIYRSVRRQFEVQQQQRNFLMAVTHELKTPIAVSRLNLETLQKHNLDENRKGRLIHVTLQETMRLDTLINNILLASQLEGDSYKMSKDELDLSDLVNAVIQQFTERYPDRNIEVNVEPDVEMVGDTLLLKLLVSNLLENANKYSQRNTPIRLRLEKEGSRVILQVIDEGAGIPDLEKKNVFQKFYRIGNEETRRTQGTGLGLYLCHKIAQDHRGRIELKDNQPGGSNFTVQFDI
jgi:two-component system, OmpR family, sensor histidine kinase CiaH